MKLYQINRTMFKLFISCDELEERRVNLETLSSDSYDTFYSLYQIVREALRENGDLIEGCYQMDVYTYPYYGLYMILKRTEYKHNVYDAIEEDVEDSLSINIMAKGQMIYEFTDFDDVVQACRIIQDRWNLNGILYFWQSKYYLEIKETTTVNQPTLMAILLEYGEFSTITKEYLEDYGHRVCENHAITIIKKYFI